ncbi:MAG TPA: bacillithiol system redox-active protein YtxJ [Blastocatellia bacterium]|jgi:bacillithiol system protein YtxJ
MNDKLKDLTSIADLERALQESAARPVLLFKHSLTCPISARAFRELQSHLESADSRVSYNLITVQNARTVSDEAARRLRIQHQSPQAILISNGRQVWNASHFDITSASLEDAIELAGQ